MSRTKNQDVTRFLQSLPQTLRRPIERLREVQKQCDSIKAQYLRELKELEAKYKNYYDPIYDTRARLIQGEASSGLQSSTHPPPPPPHLSLDSPSVPGFWLKVFQSSSLISRTITKRDEEIIRYLMDVRAGSLSDDEVGFTLTFQFAQNAYFTNSQLTKTYVLSDDSERVLESSIGCQIHWKQDKDPRLSLVWQNGRQVSTETASFFDFFQPLQLPKSDDASEDLDFEEVHLVQESLQEDFEIGLVIKDSIIPNAVSWFTGEIAEISSSEDSSDCSSRDQINTDEEE